ncbi:hypothetical protein [Thermococcus sp.]
MNEEPLLKMIPPNGVLSVIQRDIDSGGEYFSLRLLKHLIENGETVFVFLYEPFTVFKRNCENTGLKIDDYLGKNLIIFDIFGSMYHIPLPGESIHQLSGYLDDSVFIIKLKEWAYKMLESREWKNVWLFSYTSTGVCKLFTKPNLVYKLIWRLRKLITSKVENANTILTLSAPECQEIEEVAYFASDIVIETFVDHNGQRIGIITKGINEGQIFHLFRGDEK